MIALSLRPRFRRGGLQRGPFLRSRRRRSARPGWRSARRLLQALALIWIAHIGLDRALGYGLKYATGFGDTHLGRIGRAA